MPTPLEVLREATRGSQYENQLWLVGGVVRDELLFGTSPKDYDLTLEGDALACAQFLFERGVSSISPVVYPRFGTAMLQVLGEPVELASARAESYAEDSRKPDTRPATLFEDARRRDFTVNALMRNLHTGELFDPLETGLDDLKAEVLRTPLDPDTTFFDDPLRMLRAVRFKHKLHFSFVEGIEPSIRRNAMRLKVISPERITEELMKMLALPNADEALRDLQELGLTAEFMPEMDAMVGVNQGDWHHLDVFGHTLAVVKSCPPDRPDLKLAALFHDIGKPPTRFVDDQGRIRFFGHEAVGASIAGRVLQRLHFANRDIDFVQLLVKNHMRIGSAEKWSATAIRRLIRDMGGRIDDLLLLCEADQNGQKATAPKLDFRNIREQVDSVRQVTPKEALESPLSGNQIMEVLNIETGPEVGNAKTYLTELVLEGELAPDDEDGARKRLEAWRKSTKP
ncbi:MAG: HD domain-containing protein [Armatimonadetes bacterium]|nr:HD domain-containing protein [Armatimonadota bacterium]